MCRLAVIEEEKQQWLFMEQVIVVIIMGVRGFLNLTSGPLTYPL